MRKQEISYYSGGEDVTKAREQCEIKLQVLANLLNQFLILTLVTGLAAGVHGKNAAPLVLILIFGDKMEVQVTSCIAIGAVIDLVRVKSGLQCAGYPGDVCEVRISFFIRQERHVADMALVRDDDTAWMALLFE